MQDFHRGDEGERRRDDLVARPDAERHERGLEGVRAIGTRDDVEGVRFGVPQPIGEVPGEVMDRRTVDELARTDDLEHGGVDLFLDAGILPDYVHHVQLHAPRIGVGAKIACAPTRHRQQSHMRFV